MGDRIPEFESSDKKGTTVVYSSTVGTSWTAVPVSAGNNIQSFIVENDIENTVTNTLSISLDGGTTTHAVLYPSGVSSHVIKGTQTQIWLKGFAVSCAYRLTIDFEDPV